LGRCFQRIQQRAKVNVESMLSLLAIERFVFTANPKIRSWESFVRERLKTAALLVVFEQVGAAVAAELVFRLVNLRIAAGIQATSLGGRPIEG
jgi:hypothetical protein